MTTITFITDTDITPCRKAKDAANPADFGDTGRGGRGGHHGGHHGGPAGPGGWGGRARRGDAKFLLLDALQSGPKHGYEIIKAMEERSGGQWAPSPGTVYPTLQFLEDAGFVRAEQSGDRRIST